MEQTDTKSNQWFGATVTSAGINGPIVVSIWWKASCNESLGYSIYAYLYVGI